MPMLVGMIYGLMFQALALSRLGRHADAVAASEESVALLSKDRPDGAEHILRWHAQVLTAAGRSVDAAAVRAQADAEIDAKAAKLRDPELKKHYLASRQRT
jgi:hypothetical protein